MTEISIKGKVEDVIWALAVFVKRYGANVKIVDLKKIKKEQENGEHC